MKFFSTPYCTWSDSESGSCPYFGCDPGVKNCRGVCILPPCLANGSSLTWQHQTLCVGAPAFNQFPALWMESLLIDASDSSIKLYLLRLGPALTQIGIFISYGVIYGGSLIPVLKNQLMHFLQCSYAFHPLSNPTFPQCRFEFYSQAI